MVRDAPPVVLVISTMTSPLSVYTAYDGSRLEFDRGNFDEWCVWEVHPDGRRYAPRDVDYFGTLLTLAEQVGHSQVYSDFVAVYEVAGENVTPLGQRIANSCSLKYQEFSGLAEKTFMVLLMSMIAENQKRNTRLGKRIKRLGVYELLFKSKNVAYSANFMKGMKWQQIDALCRELGF